MNQFIGKITKFFIDNGKLSLLLVLTLFFWGIGSFFLTAREYNPQVVVPAFSVQFPFYGATAQEVEGLIISNFEDYISDIDGVEDVSSLSRPNFGMIQVSFKVGLDKEESNIKLFHKVQEKRDTLPPGASWPIIKAIDIDNIPILSIALYSDKWDTSQLRDLGEDIADRIKLIQDTSNIEVLGGERKQMNIAIDPIKLNSYKVSLLDIASIIESENIKVLSGSLKNPKSQTVTDIYIDGALIEEENVKNILLKKDEKGKVYLKDVATITYSHQEKNDFTRLSNSEGRNYNSVFISVAKKHGTNAVIVSQNLLKKLDEIKESIPSDVKFQIVRNDGKVADQAVKSLVASLFQSLIIVVLVLLIFLGPKEAAIVAIAIPLTVSVVFGVGFITGQTINRITLFALILSLGLLVDAAIVVVENIYRFINIKGESPSRAAVLAINEIASGLAMSTITSVLAFLPMLFVTGMMGPYMGPIPINVPVALVTSALLAYTINPWLASIFFKAKKASRKSNAELKESKLVKLYRKTLSILLNHKNIRKVFLLTVFALFIVSVLLFPLRIVQFRMLPKADKKQFYVYIDAPNQTIVERTNEIALEFEKIILEDDNVDNLQSFIGIAPVLDFNGMFRGASLRGEENNATLKVNLIPQDQRDDSSEIIAMRMRDSLSSLIKEKFPKTNFIMVEDPPGPPVRSTFMIAVSGENSQKIRSITQDLYSQIDSKFPEIADIDTSLQDIVGQVTLSINRERLSLYGISTAEISTALKSALDGVSLGILHDSSEKYPVLINLRLKKDKRETKQILQELPLVNRQGETVYLSEVADIRDSYIQTSIWHENRLKSEYIYGEMGRIKESEKTARSSAYLNMDLFSLLNDYKLPDGSGKIISKKPISLNHKDLHFKYLDKDGEEIKISFLGEWKMTVRVFRDLGSAMAVAVFLIYLALVAQFKSFKVPVLILSTIPLSMIGILPGFALLGIYFNATAMIGVIALAGIVVNNAIILIEYLKVLESEGKGIKDALITAGAVRLRPIFLTTATTVLGSITIALGDPVWAGLGWAIILGLSISSVLTLLIFPTLYFVFLSGDWQSEVE